MVFVCIPLISICYHRFVCTTFQVSWTVRESSEFISARAGTDVMVGMHYLANHAGRQRRSEELGSLTISNTAGACQWRKPRGVCTDYTSDRPFHIHDSKLGYHQYRSLLSYPNVPPGLHPHDYL